jgi:hypothetical protein
MQRVMITAWVTAAVAVVLFAPVADEAGAGTSSAPGRVLELRVVNERSREAIAGADLEIWLSGARKKDVTDEQGRCRVEHSGEISQNLIIRASKAGFVPVSVAWPPGVPRIPIPDSYTLALEPGTSIGGIIQDEDGKPIAGARVELLVSIGGELKSVSIRDQQYKTDAAGRWRCDTVPAKLDDVSIRLEHPDYVSDDMFGRTPKPPMEKLRDMTGVMVMKKGVALAGRVLDTKGRSIEGASVMQGSMRLGTHYPGTRTDQEGRFQFRHVRPGTTILTIQAAGYSPGLEQLVVQKEGEPVEFRLARGRTLRGQVVDQAGQPIPGASVAVEGWRGYRSLQWRVDTDAQGQFRWDEAPADEVLIDVVKQHYMNIRRHPMTASDQKYTITMPPVLRVTGRVLDQETGQPILRGTVFPGTDRGDSRPVYWNGRRARPFADGRYEVAFTEPSYAHLIRIEAEGYVPEVSRPFDNGEGQVAFDVTMKEGTGPSGIVCFPDGRPAPGAEVILCTRARGAYIRAGRNVQKRDSTFVETGPDGRFAFPAQADTYTLVALHERGYAQVTDDEMIASSQVTLQPWGRVEGELLLGSRAGAGQTVQLLFDRPLATGAPRIQHDCGTVADKDGHFILDRLPPGKGNVCRMIKTGERSARFADLTPIEVKAGETVRVKMGGTGRPVTGKIIVPAEAKDRLDWETMDYYLVRRSPEGSSPSWAFQLERDGTFRAENITAGDYRLYLQAYALPVDAGGGRGERLGNLSHFFTVPDMPGGRSDEPLDLGALELPIVETAVTAVSLIGKPLPDLTALKLEISAGALAGKGLLVCFFDVDQRPSRNTLLQLAQRESPLRDKGIVLIGVQGAKTDETRLTEWLQQNAISFPVGLIPGNETKTRLAWGVRSLPWLILTDAPHIVCAEGFGVTELDDRMKNVDK